MACQAKGAAGSACSAACSRMARAAAFTRSMPSEGFHPQGRQRLFLRPCPRFRLSSHRRRCTPCGLPCSLPCASCPALQGRRLCPFSVGLMRGVVSVVGYGFWSAAVLRCRVNTLVQNRVCNGGCKGGQFLVLSLPLARGGFHSALDLFQGRGGFSPCWWCWCSCFRFLSAVSVGRVGGVGGVGGLPAVVVRHG